MNILAVIPARGGSKGIPGKNLRTVAGKSLIEWSIAAAKQSNYQLRVVVSTDSEEITAVAQRSGAEVIFRPPEISGDSASSESALLHALQVLGERDGYHPELLVFLQCTSPLTASEDIDGTIHLLLEKHADSALAVTPFHYFLWHEEDHGNWSGINHDKALRQLRQEREPQFVETGAVYVVRPAGFQIARHRFFGKTVAYVTPPERRWEIDDPIDLEIAEMLLLSQPKPAISFKPDAIIFDFDGVFTDNKVYLDQDGREMVRCDRGDGMGIEMLRQRGIPMLVLSKERNPVVQARANKLGIECLHGIDDKFSALSKWTTGRGFPLARCAYVGNDMNDIECMLAVGISAAPADADRRILSIADIVLTKCGGVAAIREFAEIVVGIAEPL